ncbi:MAG: CPBP family intramembrane metalloprotease [Acidobacteriia bacterium]|nr:CPBP family intramembrane metalloprotease [Terriglobia bacterium]
MPNRGASGNLNPREVLALQRLSDGLVMQMGVLALLIAAVLCGFSSRVQKTVRSWFARKPVLLWAVPLILTAIFSLAAVAARAWNWGLGGLSLAYTAAPVACMAAQGPGFAKRPSTLDFAAILFLWLPLEFGAGARLVALPARGYLHSVAYGIAILLGLILFLGFRWFPGLKYNLPRNPRDLGLAFAGFALLAPVLIVLGIAIGFIPPPHLPIKSLGTMAVALGTIFLGTALPEEILFRSLIQNLLMLRFGNSMKVLLAASFIFGCAHLDNGPQPLPNWRYMILATIAGVAYGRVFQKASSVAASAALHTMVDWTKHFYF